MAQLRGGRVAPHTPAAAHALPAPPPSPPPAPYPATFPAPSPAPSPPAPAPAPASVFNLPTTYKAARDRAAALIRVVNGVVTADVSSLHALAVSMTHPEVASYIRGYTEDYIRKARPVKSRS
jgi:hypothetical protein